MHKFKRLTQWLAIAAVVVPVTTFAGGASKAKDVDRFDVCFSPGDIFVEDFNHDGGSPGDTLAATGILLPLGTIPATGAPPNPDGLGGFLPVCGQYQSLKVGDVFVDAQNVLSAANGTTVDPNALDVLYARVHLRVDGVGELELSGITRIGSGAAQFPYVITGGFGKFESLRGKAVFESITLDTQQTRLYLPRAN